MSKTISTILNLKDNFSETIKKVTSNTSAFTREIKQSEAQASKAKTGIVGVFKDIGDSIKDGIGLGAGMDIWDSGKEGIIGMITFGSDLQKSLNGIQTATGYSEKSMSSMKQVMLDIYNDNFGQNFQDIGDAIKTIGQQTGATGDDLKGLAEDGLLLKDTFGFEINESIRSAKMMMDQFGLSGDEAYNLMAQGAQYGLDKNGDLLDSINEYSVQFKQAGFSADEMFNMLMNGSANGTFSVDKLGDAVKEFGIRSKDGSKSTMGAFQSLGLDANKLSQQFAKGGESGKAAFNEVNKKLLSMKDPLAQNQIGVALWGSMWEDLGVKGITALTDTQGEISNTTNALKDINNVKYADIGSALEGIKRNLQTGILMPISDAVLPKLSEFSNWFVSNMPTIKETVGGLTQKFLDLVSPIGDMLSHSKDVYNFINDNWSLIGPIVEIITLDILAWKVALIAINTWTMIVGATSTIYGTIELAIWGVRNATGAWEAAQWLLNVALDANPIGATILILGALGLAIYEVVKHWKDICTWIEKAWNWLTKWNDTEAEDKTPKISSTSGQYQFITGKKNPTTYNFITGENALGTDYWKGGPTSINEHGGEIIDLPSGSRVIPADKSANMLKNNGKVNVFVTIQGNVIGNEEFAEEVGEHVGVKVLAALNNM